MIFIIKGVWTIVFIFIVIFHNVSARCKYRKKAKSGFMPIQNVVEITIKMKTIVRKPLMIDCSNSVNHNREQMLNIPYLLVVRIEPAKDYT